MFSFRHKEAFEIVKILYDDIGCVFCYMGSSCAISTWLAAQHYKITPWVYPFISNSVFLQMVIVGGTLFLFSDAPFFDETQLLLIVRMNRVQWCMAQMIYICVSTMVYFAAIAFVSIFLFIPNITFSSRWGAVILALSRGETNLENVMSFSKYITESMSPIGANALCRFFRGWQAFVWQKFSFSLI